MSQEPLRAEYFVTRKDGKMVPLVAVDELPHHITIEGVSRIMSPFDIAGMTCVGRSTFRHRTYAVQDAPELAASNKAPGHDALKAKYFITRDSGNMVPLVAMDEMPESFDIKSVPRNVSVFEIGGMTCVGIGEARDLVHVVEDVNNAPMSYFTERSATEKTSQETETTSSTPVPEMGALSLINPPKTPNEHIIPPSTNQAVIANPGALGIGYIMNAPTPQLHLPTIEPQDLLTDQEPIFTSPPLRSTSSILSTRTMTPGVKEYCSYWLRHGECDYQQQGCLYKHEMPLDQATLTRLGLRDIPRWYREKHALGSYLAAGGSGAAFSGESLKSAAATGLQEDDKTSKMSLNWRSGSKSGFRSPSNTERRQSNIYSPRSSRFSMDPSSFSRLPPNTPPAIPFHTHIRGNDTIHRRQQYQTYQALRNLEKNNPPRRAIQSVLDKESALIDDADGSVSEAASGNVPLSRRRSTSTILSDIEALVGRQDAARRAKEDAEYAKVVAAHKAKNGDVERSASTAPKEGTSSVNNGGSRRSSGGNRRKNRGPPRRAPTKQLGGKPAAGT